MLERVTCEPVESPYVFPIRRNRMTATNLTSAARTVTGRVRDGNEDSLLSLPEAGLFAVADGMGGHAAGEVASRLAVEALEAALAGDGGSDRPAPPDAERMVGAIREANRAIRRDAGEHPERSGMGTTVTALALAADGRWRIGHVGDSRAYRLRDGDLRQLTVDHSWVGKRVAEGELTKEEARRHPMSSVLERALGTSAEVEVDVEEGDARPGDLLLLCSDGLSDMLPDPEIESLLAGTPAGGAAGRRSAEDTGAAALEDAVDRLVDAANRAGGEDNVSVVLVRVGA